MASANESVIAPESKLYLPPVRNIWETGKVCTGSMAQIKAGMPLAGKAEIIKHMLWNAPANNDLDGRSNQAAEAAGFKGWKDMIDSKKVEPKHFATAREHTYKDFLRRVERECN